MKPWRQQNPIEFDWFIDVLLRNGVRSYLEIGSKWGLAILSVAERLPVPSLFVSVDLDPNKLLVESIEKIRKMGHEAHLIAGDSADRKVVKAVKSLGWFDACFIDGNHTLPYLEADFANYSPVSQIVAFHDIGWIAKETGPQIDAPQFWERVRHGYHKFQEINLNQRRNGIGVLWMEDPAAWAARPYTRTPRDRRASMVAALQQVEPIEGDIVECGVWRGGNIIIARKLLPDRVCWLYDTFEGMTRPGPEDTGRDGAPALARYEQGAWCAASKFDVVSSLTQAGVYDPDRLRFVEGDVCETLRTVVPDKIALLRLDTDWYASTKIELEVLFPRLVSGGILIVDDYGHWQGARKAVDEYFEGQDVAFSQIDYTAVMMTKD